MKYLLPIFVISFCILALIFVQIQFFTPVINNPIPVTEYKSFYPLDLHSSGIASNDTHYIFFGGTIDDWDGNDTVFSVSKQQLQNLDSIKNPNTLYPLIGHMPYPVYDMGVIQDGLTVYLFGGFNNYTVVQTILKVDMSVYPFNYTIINNMSYGLESPDLLQIGNLVYIFGGNNAYIQDMNREVYVFNSSDNSIADLGIKVPLSDSAVKFYNGEIYLLGGIDPDTGRYSNGVYLFNPGKNSFSLITSLPVKLNLFQSFQINNNLFVYNQQNSSYYSNQPIAIDLNNFQISYLSVPFFTNGSYFQGQQLVMDNTFNLWFFGGVNGTVRSYNVYDMNLSSFFGKQITDNKFDNNKFSSYNNNSIFSANPNCINFDFQNEQSQLIQAINPITLKTNDVLSLSISYLAHNDNNTRQGIFIGFTSETPLNPINQQNSVPSANFIGIRLRNQAGLHDENFVSVTGLIVKNQISLLEKSVFLLRNQYHNIDFSVTLTNSSFFYYSLSIDGNIISELKSGQLNLQINSFSMWNMNNSIGWPLQGFFKGKVMNFNLIQAPAISDNQFILQMIALFLVINLLALVILTYIVIMPQFKYLSTGVRPEGVPTSIINLGFYNLYIQLKKTFEKLEKFSIVSLEDETRKFGDTFDGKFEFLKGIDVFSFEHETLDDISGIAIKILINLLDYLDHGTYLTNIQINSGINRSSFYYTINKLKEKELIQITSPIGNDQRKKLVSISPKGYSLLKLVYTHLDSYFNGNK